MHNLFTYVSAINQVTASTVASNKFITEQLLSTDTSEDDGIVTESAERLVTFTNGVKVKQTIEFDDVQEGFDVQGQSDAVCAECWISYSVVCEPEGLNIQPKRKSFINKCQQSFWLKMSRSQT